MTQFDSNVQCFISTLCTKVKPVKNVTNQFSFNKSIKICTNTINFGNCIIGRKTQSASDSAKYLTHEQSARDSANFLTQGTYPTIGSVKLNLLIGLSHCLKITLSFLFAFLFIFNITFSFIIFFLSIFPIKGTGSRFLNKIFFIFYVKH